MAEPVLRYFACGSTAHQLAMLFARQPRERRAFPSGVYLFDGGDGRRVLFDAGYAAAPWRAGLSGIAYRALVPPKITPEQTAAAQLAAVGIDPATVTHLVVSHLHPDHIGGVRDFPGARIVATEEAVGLLSERRLLDGVLPGLLPARFPPEGARLVAREEFTTVEVTERRVRVDAVDLFGDGSFLIIDLPGHQSGHVGAIIANRVVLAADAAWGHDLADGAQRLRAIPRRINHDMAAYGRTAELLADLADAGLRVVYSHDIDTPAVLLP
jgi:glyoxylase-like metal-dependent hydrolase (beta-lactamase superfamily II)